ncbi:hypothetical protein CJ178_03020 [Rhodococcus sp. ACPA4]|uniref:DUF7683 domain-containing protein n=1 Tax=Rhodococcus TaxID=1827 RepID=UPI000BDC196D|nr:hypothetical protein CJ178_03020 [Rhodococcus sp. ACPA4]
MWHLEAFDNGNNRLVKDYALHDMAVEIVKEILGIDDTTPNFPSEWRSPRQSTRVREIHL